MSQSIAELQLLFFSTENFSTTFNWHILYPRAILLKSQAIWITNAYHDRASKLQHHPFSTSFPITKPCRPPRNSTHAQLYKRDSNYPRRYTGAGNQCEPCENAWYPILTRRSYNSHLRKVDLGKWSILRAESKYALCGSSDVACFTVRLQ
jgi:hypothetical protein